MHFLNENDRIPIRISPEFVPCSLIDNKPAFFGSGNGLVPNKRQAITWTNADTLNWCIYTALGGDELNHKMLSLPHPVAWAMRCLSIIVSASAKSDRVIAGVHCVILKACHPYTGGLEIS